MTAIVCTCRAACMWDAEKIRRGEVKIWSRPGAKYHQLLDLVDDHILYWHGGAPLYTDHHIYVIGGMCNITTKKYSHHYTEVIYEGDTVEVANRAIEEINILHANIIERKCVPIFCTIATTSLLKYNQHLLTKTKQII